MLYKNQAYKDQATMTSLPDDVKRTCRAWQPHQHVEFVLAFTVYCTLETAQRRTFVVDFRKAAKQQTE